MKTKTTTETKIRSIAVMLLAAVLLVSCSNRLEPMPDTDELSNNEADMFTDEPDDSFSSVRASGEKWIDYGLKAYESGKQAENLKDFFSDSANLTYLTLYDHFFTYDEEKSVPVAEALFAFIVDEYGVEALLDVENRCEYKNAYLKSLGLEENYGNSPVVESFLASMDFSSNADYKYIISFDNVTYYFKDFVAGTPQQYHGFMYYSTTGLRRLTEYLHNNGLDDDLDTGRQFNFYMIFDGSGYSKTVYANGNIYVNDSYSTLHEAVHAMGIVENRDIWLSEGLCEYFGKTLGFNDQIAASYIQLLTMAKQGYFDEQASKGNRQYDLYKKVYEDYVSFDGSMDSVNEFDFRLYADVNARAEMDSETFVTLGEVYSVVNKTDCVATGNELSYNQASSLILYLVDTYGIENVLDAYSSQNVKSVFGKEYEELKSDWLDYLNREYSVTVSH